MGFVRTGLAWLFVLVLATVPAQAVGSQPAAESRVYARAAVAADHELASRAGVEVLKRGGNVVDAAVATSFALSVVRPESCGLGGGGFMVIWLADRRQAIAIDYRERAPRAATEDMFRDPADPAKVVPGLSSVGHKAVAVPGTVAGLCYALDRYGTQRLATVLEPALRYAREGFPADAHYVATVRERVEEFQQRPDYRQRFAALWNGYLNAGRSLAVGDRVVSPLAEVLDRIAEHGAAGFYEGPVAEAIAAEMRRGGGLITAEDLRGVQPVERPALEGRFRRHRLITMPPPSSGGTALIEMLNILERQPLRRWGHNSTRYTHVLAEAMKHTFADRARWMGDPDFVSVPVGRLTSKQYARQLASRIDLARTAPPRRYGSHVLPDDGGTSHFSVLDAHGNAAACTETINLAFGSLVVEPRYGIVLNNEMDDFTAAPGEANRLGLIQSEANRVAAGKKPLSSMTPTIALHEGRAVWVVGASGGPRIISATLQVLLGGLLFGMEPAEAVRMPRAHHQWQPDVLLLERALIRQHSGRLEDYGHETEQREKLATVQAASRAPEGVRAAADPRKGGHAAGY